jgi:hypothetical protein
LHVGGQVLNPLTLTAEALRSEYAAHTVDVTFLSGEETVTATFTGARLWDLINAAQVNVNADVRNDLLSMFILASGADRYQAVIAWGEIDPGYGNQQILVAYERDGAPLEALQLVVPNDARAGRYVNNLVSLEVRDAPHIGQ